MTRVVDLRSDAVTQPTDEMWDAMRTARLGWAAAGEDENVHALEAQVAGLLGKETGLLVHGGSTANLLALVGQCERGEQVIFDDLSHILWAEEWGFAYVGGVVHKSVPGDRGRIPPASLSAAILSSSFRHRPRTALVCLENSHNAAGGVTMPPYYMAEIGAIARAHGVKLHVDGARLLNAAAHHGVEARVLVADADSVSFNLNKGLSAPWGAVLCGSRELIERSRVNMKRLGVGTPHQAGLFAVAGLVGLRTLIAQHALDNQRAQTLAGLLADLAPELLRVWPVETNIVFLSAKQPGVTAASLQAQLKSLGVLVSVAADDTIRMVTHRHIDDEDIEFTATVLRHQIR